MEAKNNKNIKSIIIVIIIIFLIAAVYIGKTKFGNSVANNNVPQAPQGNNIYTAPKVYKIYNFTSRNCPVCIQVKPIYDKMKTEFGSSINFVDVDTDDINNRGLLYKYGIAYTPTFLIVDENGNQVDKFIGYMSENQFRTFISKWSSK